jgi:hypothetical protein
MTTVKSRAHRILRSLTTYSTEPSKIHEFAEKAGISSDQLIGVYVNADARLQAMLISKDAVHLIKNRDEVYSIPYTLIERIDGPVEKVNSDEVTLHLKNGIAHVLPITARRGKFKDVFAFVTFFDRVMADSQSDSP